MTGEQLLGASESLVSNLGKVANGFQQKVSEADNFSDLDDACEGVSADSIGHASDGLDDDFDFFAETEEFAKAFDEIKVTPNIIGKFIGILHAQATQIATAQSYLDTIYDTAQRTAGDVLRIDVRNVFSKVVMARLDASGLVTNDLQREMLAQFVKTGKPMDSDFTLRAEQIADSMEKQIIGKLFSKFKGLITSLGKIVKKREVLVILSSVIMAISLIAALKSMIRKPGKKVDLNKSFDTAAQVTSEYMLESMLAEGFLDKIKDQVSRWASAGKEFVFKFIKKVVLIFVRGFQSLALDIITVLKQKSSTSVILGIYCPNLLKLLLMVIPTIRNALNSMVH